MVVLANNFTHEWRSSGSAAPSAETAPILVAVMTSRVVFSATHWFNVLGESRVFHIIRLGNPPKSGALRGSRDNEG